MGDLLHSAWAIFRGVLVAFLLAILAGVLIAVLFYSVVGAPATVAPAVPPWAAVIGALLNLACILGGGWQAGRVAGHAEIGHGLVVGAIVGVVGLGLTQLTSGFTGTTVGGWDWLAAVLSIGAGGLGGFVSRRPVPATASPA